MRCEDIMRSPVELCHDWETVQAAARKMAERNIGFVPVCDQRGRVVGTLTDRDIAVRVVADDRTASETRVADVMSCDVVCCSPDDDLADAERLMAENRKSRIVVIDGTGVVGVISVADIAAIPDWPAVQTLRTVVRTRYYN